MRKINSLQINCNIKDSSSQSQSKDLSVKVESLTNEISLNLKDYETKTGIKDAIIILEYYVGVPRLLVWNDINKEDPMIIPLDKAHIKCRTK